MLRREEGKGKPHFTVQDGTLTGGCAVSIFVYCAFESLYQSFPLAFSGFTSSSLFVSFLLSLAHQAFYSHKVPTQLHGLSLEEIHT